MTTTVAQTTADSLTQEMIDSYRQRGFVRVPGVISPEEAAEYHEAALAVSARKQGIEDRHFHDRPVFTQIINVWREDEAMKALTLHPNVAAVAERLAGIPLHIWHDHLLIKQPQKSTPTEFHQDQPYWPHANSTHSLSAWIALCDVPVERGCMTFLPGSHSRTDLAAQNLNDAHDLLEKAPELVWSERVTVPLRAGDCTFHHSRCAHMAGPNLTQDPRVAHVIIYMDATTTYTGARHVITDPLGLAVGQALDGEIFPRVELS
jgi:phytanoyl-CoA hydroxylase